MSGHRVAKKDKGPIFTPAVAFFTGATLVGLLGGIGLVVTDPYKKAPALTVETVTVTQEVPVTEVLSDDEIRARYIELQAAALPDTALSDVSVAVSLAVNVCENVRGGASVLDQPGVLEDGIYQFAVQDAWDFTELAIRTYCPEYNGDIS